jgi:hypothetical protein
VTISAFMIVKNVLKQGYPVVESIASTLPICDEFLISDGYSTDGTFELLQKLEKLNKKIKISQIPWVKKNLSVLADVSNQLRKQCTSDYLFYIQAAEVVHEDSIKMIKALPEFYPKNETFCLPFTSVVGNSRINEEFRLRFVKNLDRLNLTGDAWAFSVSCEFIRSEAKHNLAHPKLLLSLIGRGIEWTYAGSLNGLRSRAIYLPKPVYRYPALFKENFIERCKGHSNLLNLPMFNELSTKIENLQGETFFEEVTKFYRGNDKSFGEYSAVKTEEQPRLMQELIEKRTEIPRYIVRESILDEISKL